MLYQGKKVIDMENFVENLSIGDKMPIQLRKKDGVVLIDKGRIVTQRIKETLKKLQDEIQHIELDKIDPKDADQVLNMGREPIDTVNNEVMDNAKKSIQEIMESFDSSTVENLKESMEEVVNSIAKSTKFQPNIERRYVLQLADKSSHASAVACFSILLAKLYNNKLKASNPQISKDSLINLEEIAMAAVLKDMGNVREGTINENIKKMILLSNEPETEKDSLKEPKDIDTQKTPIIMGGKILHICDIYDKLMEDAIRQEHSLEEVSAAMFQYTVDGTINKELGQLFMSNVPLYPIKTRVKLSDGRSARVIKTFYDKDEINRPTVERVDTGEIIELTKRDNANITIASLVTKLMYPKLIEHQIEYMKTKAMQKQSNINDDLVI